jgi:hypothetical protein
MITDPLSFKFLSSLKYLRRLSLIQVQCFTDESCQFLKDLKNLKYLTIHEPLTTGMSFNFYNPRTNGFLGAVPGVPGDTLLTNLGLFPNIAELPNLIFLELSGLRGITDDGWKYMDSKKSPKLAEIRLISNHFIGKDHLRGFLSQNNNNNNHDSILRHVTSLTISSANSSCMVDDFGLLNLLKCEPASLSVLNLGGCCEITHISSLSSLAHTLVDLSLSGLHRLDDNQIANLVSLQNLEALNLSNLDKLTDSAFDTFSQLPHLKKLVLSNAKKVTSASLEKLSNLSELEVLSMNLCVGLGGEENEPRTCAALIVLLKNNTNLNVLSFSSIPVQISGLRKILIEELSRERISRIREIVWGRNSSMDCVALLRVCFNK